MMQELDVRDLPAPEPFERIITALRTLPDHDELLVHIHREPFPLYDILRQHAFVYQTLIINAQYFQIRIKRESRSA